MQPRKPITDEELIVRINKLLNAEKRLAADLKSYMLRDGELKECDDRMTALCVEAKRDILKISRDESAIDQFMLDLAKKLGDVTFEANLARLQLEAYKSASFLSEDKVEKAVEGIKSNIGVVKQSRDLFSLESYMQLRLKSPEIAHKVHQRKKYEAEEDAAQARRDAAIAAPAPVKKSGFLRGLFGSSKPKPSDSGQGQELVGSVRPGPRKNSDSK